MRSSPPSTGRSGGCERCPSTIPYGCGPSRSPRPSPATGGCGGAGAARRRWPPRTRQWPRPPRPGAVARREDAPLRDRGEGGELRRPQRCYVCKRFYRQLDSFYHRLCPDCAADNSARRALGTDLRGRRALITGGRVKIGFQLALMMLRDGAEVLVTSRFPHDTLCRFRAQEGSAEWIGRLACHRRRSAGSAAGARSVRAAAGERGAAGHPGQQRRADRPQAARVVRRAGRGGRRRAAARGARGAGLPADARRSEAVRPQGRWSWCSTTSTRRGYCPTRLR